MIEINVSPDHAWCLLRGEEILGLDKVKTRERFEAVLLRVFPHPAKVVYREEMTAWDIEFTGDGPWINKENEDTLVGWVKDLFINMEWLTYESPEAHCAALVNRPRQATVNHIVCLPGILPSNYPDRDRKELRDMPVKLRDPEVWDVLKLGLGLYAEARR